MYMYSTSARAAPEGSEMIDEGGVDGVNKFSGLLRCAFSWGLLFEGKEKEQIRRRCDPSLSSMN
ncbi:hypothetical protein BCR33DRAFT_719364 [Rhizoclosmatium globosum]|uniref:Uncharacterized protein n=1 Tax=Rhizoclosmatium globosum TaxID=329046 RepID=A0A1Y2C061_9FUNG|nr:hypothetical protein BCR33DRAFT_719364 [Rhizoclosmatium globosum]|eukprot:ORY40366.1 hypothetical protein BCR33DRAFT_719364 [Rhizoclosmatium globosum]